MDKPAIEIEVEFIDGKVEKIRTRPNALVKDVLAFLCQKYCFEKTPLLLFKGKALSPNNKLFEGRLKPGSGIKVVAKERMKKVL